ncbi:beta strand repeat-containing protein [Methanobrevibacter curvatus]|uniref:DUF11 domain-containing protein n=1 Tax=Methanobrevibacter curvatus TaxID=49547 RepID=A0A165YXG0_9EURY|nr:Ig-like domain repeat protein [Methanobrevibacter curvatus]KZX09984.1 hypothetical protein MBCUR_20010 [Methanobrevibacter curvatus]
MDTEKRFSTSGKLVLIVSLFAVLFFISLSSVNATVIYANTTTDLKFQVEQVLDPGYSANNTIYLANGTYSQWQRHFNIQLNKSVTFIGSGNTKIQGNRNDWLFNVQSGYTVSFINIIFINGNGTNFNFGGAINNQGGTLTVENCKFYNNGGREGGAIRSDSSATVNIINSEFINNTGLRGGAIYSNGALNITSSNFINNSATNSGGVIYLSANKVLTIHSSNFTNNSASATGGAIYTQNSVGSSVSGSFFIGNNNSAIASSGDDGFSVSGSTFINNTYGIKATNVSNMVINYNRFVNNSLYSLDAVGSNYVDVNLNWWGQNNISGLYSGVTIGNYYVMRNYLNGVNGSIYNVTQSYPYYTTAILSYNFTLNDSNVSNDPLLLPYFVANVTFSHPNGTEEQGYYGDAKISNVSFNVILTHLNYTAYIKSSVDNEDLIYFLNAYSEFNLTVNKTANINGLNTKNGTVLNNQTFNYTINVTNNGFVGAYDLNITDLLNYSHLELLEAIATSGTYNNLTGVWELNLTAGESALLTLVVRANSSGFVINNANVTTLDNNTGDNSSQANITILPAVNLNITKRVNASQVMFNGEVLKYIITVTNNGLDNATGVNLTDILPNNLIYLNYSSTPGTSYDNNTGVWIINNITNGYTVVLNITVKVNGSNITINNTVSLTTIDQINTGDNSSFIEFTSFENVNLTITKTANVTGDVINGLTINYTIIVNNTGTDDAVGVYVNETLPSQLIYQSHTESPQSTFDPVTGIWHIDEIPIGQFASLIITVLVNGTGTITNNVTLNTSQNNSGNNYSEVSINVSPSANISISKTANITTLLNGQYVNYIINVTNHGNNATDINITDILNSKLIFDQTNGTYTNDSQVISWTIINLAPGESYIISLIVKAIGTGYIENNVTVNNTNISNIGDNISNIETINVLPAVNLTITKTVNASQVIFNGEVLKYIITVTNNGPDNATGVNLTDILPNNLIYLNYSSTPGTSYDNNTGVWIINNITNGYTVVLNITVKVNGSNITINNTVSLTTIDQINTGDNSSFIEITSFENVNLTITKTANVTGDVINGLTINYTIIVNNTGTDDAVGVYVNETLPSQLIYQSHTESPQSTFDPVTGIWHIDEIPIGQFASLIITVLVNGTGTITNNVTLNTSQNNSGNNYSEVSINVLPSANISISKTANITTLLNGKYVNYTINVTNHGNNATDINITDTLDSKLIFDQTNGTYTNNSQAISWTITNLAPGESYIISLIVKAIGTGYIENNVTINNTNISNIGDNISNIETINVLPAINLTVVKTVNATSALNGDLLTYIITVTNNGPDNATNVAVSEVLDSRLVLVSNITSAGSYDGSVWSVGTINVGQSVTLTLVVRINGTGVTGNNVTVSTPDQNNAGNNTTGSNSTTVLPSVNLSVVKAVNATSALNGGLLTYTIIVTNNGPDNATNVAVSEVLDSRLVLVSNITSAGSYDGSVWNIGTITVGQSVTLTLVVRINGTGVIGNNVTVSTPDQNNAGNNTTNSNNTTALSSVDLELKKTANVTKTFVGRFVKYTLVVVNHGPDVAHNVAVYDRLESKLSFVYATSSNYDPVTGIWFVGDLSMGASATLVIVAKVISPGRIINVANVSSDDNIRNSSYVSNATNRTVIINASKVPTPLDINTTTIVVVDNKTDKVGVPLNLTATLTDDKGKPIAGMPIKFYINGKYIGTSYTNVKGLAFITYIPVSSGKFTITAEFQGRTGFKHCKVIGLLIVKGKDNNNDNDGKAGMKHTGIPVVLLIILLILLIFASRIRKSN